MNELSFALELHHHQHSLFDAGKNCYIFKNWYSFEGRGKMSHINSQLFVSLFFITFRFNFRYN